jgi:hypothetical protein
LDRPIRGTSKGTLIPLSAVVKIELHAEQSRRSPVTRSENRAQDRIRLALRHLPADKVTPTSGHAVPRRGAALASACRDARQLKVALGGQLQARALHSLDVGGFVTY